MKNLMEVMKVSKDDLPAIYCDMDEVLCAFLKGANKAIGGDFPSMDKNKRWKLIVQTKDFWANLEWQPGGKQLWAYIRQFDPDILTSPMDKQGHNESLEGKLIWVERNLGLSPDKVNFAHDKYKYAISEDGKPNILIDDFETKVKPFTEAGGIGILHLGAKNTIKILELLKDSDKAP